jgi:hypothetical protein
MADFVKSTGKTVPVVIAITKAELCSGEVLSEGVNAIKDKMLPGLFTQGSEWLVMISPVSLGNEKSGRFEINPLNVHLPVTFAVYYALLSQRDMRLHETERQTLQKHLGLLKNELLGDKLYMFFGGRRFTT